MPNSPYFAITTAFEHSYTAAIDSLMMYGRTVCPRGFETKELSPFTLGFENSRKRLIFNPERKVNLAFMLAECLWIMNGREDVEMVVYYNSKIAQFSDDGTMFHGAYGPRLRHLVYDDKASFPSMTRSVDQFQLVIDKLKSDPDSRQAICNIFYAAYDYKKTKDVPCTLTYHFLLREKAGEKQLELIASMRSNDIILGLSTDAFNFSIIQEVIASELEVNPGWYYHVDGSLHIYKRDYEWAERILANRARKVSEILEMPSMPYHSLQYVKLLGEREEDLRKNHALSIDGLPEYWQKWLLVFACYKAIKNSNIEKAQDYNDMIGEDHPFHIFMKRSIDRKKQKIAGEHE